MLSRVSKDAIHRLFALTGYRIENIAAERAREAALLASQLAPSVWDGLYEKRFSPVSLSEKRFYNFGAGGWRHRFWTNIDYTSEWYAYDGALIDVNWDIASFEAAPIMSGLGEAAFCSHTIEHLLEEHVDHLFREVCRVLKPSAVFRVTCPNARIYYEAWKRRDGSHNFHYGAPYYELGDKRSSYTLEGMSIWLVSELLTQLVNEANGHKPRFTDHRELDAILNGAPMEQALDRLAAMIDFRVQKENVGWHVSWWTPEKVITALKRAGFSDAIVSVPGGSICPVMRDRQYFDTVIPTCSMFVEGIK